MSLPPLLTMLRPSSDSDFLAELQALSDMARRERQIREMESLRRLREASSGWFSFSTMPTANRYYGSYDSLAMGTFIESSAPPTISEGQDGTVSLSVSQATTFSIADIDSPTFQRSLGFSNERCRCAYCRLIPGSEAATVAPEKREPPLNEQISTTPLRVYLSDYNALNKRDQLLTFDTALWEKSQPMEVAGIRSELKGLIDVLPPKKRPLFRDYLQNKIRGGKVDGRSYLGYFGNDECICFKGHLLRFVHGNNITDGRAGSALFQLGLQNNGCMSSTIEYMLSTGVKGGDTPKTNALLAWFERELSTLVYETEPEVVDLNYNQAVAEALLAGRLDAEPGATNVTVPVMTEVPAAGRRAIPDSVYQATAEALSRLFSP